MIEAKGRLLGVALPPEPAVLVADPVRVEQILVNLLTNAAKYTDPGGSIGVGGSAKGDGAGAGETAVRDRLALVRHAMDTLFGGRPVFRCCWTYINAVRSSARA